MPVGQGMEKARPPGKTGLLQFDTHFDVRSLESGGPSNGTPVRGLLESGTLEGKEIVQIGIHGFANSRIYRQYAEEKGITFYTMHQIWKKDFLRSLKKLCPN